MTTIEISPEYSQEAEAHEVPPPEKHANGHVNGSRKRIPTAESAPPIEARLKAHDEQRQALEKEAAAELKAVEKRREELLRLLGIGSTAPATLSVPEGAFYSTTDPKAKRKPGRKPGVPKADASEAPAESSEASPKGKRGPRADSVPSRVLAYLTTNGPSTGSAISTALGIAPGVAHGALNNLLKSKKVTSVGVRKMRAWSIA